MTQTPDKKDIKVFISYAREDSEIARDLYDDLKKAGVVPWMDKKDILIGQDWEFEIRQAVKKSSFFLALLSSYSVSKKGYVQKELKLALDVLDELPPSDIFILPVRLDDCEPHHERLKKRHWGELSPSYEDGLKDILRVIETAKVSDAPVTPGSIENEKEPPVSSSAPSQTLTASPHSAYDKESVKSRLSQKSEDKKEKTETEPPEKSVDVRESQAAVIGDGARVNGGIHIHHHHGNNKEKKKGNEPIARNKPAWKIFVFVTAIISIVFAVYLVANIEWSTFFGTDKEIISNSLRMKFVYIKPGTFTMGSPEDEPGRDDDEKQHEVTLTKGFYMQTTEVTQGQWKAVMGNKPSGFKKCGDDCPVERVSWNDVQEFITKLNQKQEGIYRLPTEAEWEYACRAGTDTPFAFGKCLSTDQANYDGNYPLDGCPKGEHRKKTTPVGSFAANAWGLYDMHGNVWEWCQDWYGDYPSGPVTDPDALSDGSYRVFRGGSWGGTARYCRSACRSRYSPDGRSFKLGFRLVLLPGQQVR